MKKVYNYFETKKAEEIIDRDYVDYEEMFQEGFTDNEIACEFGIAENYVKKLRNEYQRDY